MEIEQVWVQKRAVGDFKGFIEEMYHGKSVAPKDSMERALYKLNMNGGIHGKTITKTHRKERTFYDNVWGLREVINEPEYQATIGFTAMQNARARLLKHCRMVQEAGYRVLMCDTDSMVVEATEEQVRTVLGDAISRETGTMEDLGKLEFETSKDGMVEFEEFRCWGLKRYLELHDGAVRKTAFAGMKDSLQKEMLIDAPVDGSTFHWEQLGAKRTDYGKIIRLAPKSAKAEDVWYTPAVSPDAGKGLKEIDGLKELVKNMNRGNENEMQILRKGYDLAE